MRLCSHGCGMTDTEMELMGRKDFKMDSNLILKPNHGFLTSRWNTARLIKSSLSTPR